MTCSPMCYPSVKVSQSLRRFYGPSLEGGYVKILIWTLEPKPPVGDKVFEGLDCMPLNRERHMGRGHPLRLLLDSSLEINWCMAEVHVFCMFLADKCQSFLGARRGECASGWWANCHLPGLASGAFPWWPSSHGRATWWGPVGGAVT